MKRKSFAFILVSVALSLVLAPSTHALGLRVTPLDYRTTLAQGEKKKGVIDVANPDPKETVTVSVNAQAFRQINDKGELEYYNDPHVAAGILPDLSSFTLKPHETQRMYFLLDGTKLPQGNVFGVLMFTTKPTAATTSTGVVSAVRVGVLFSIVNGTPSDQQAAVTGLKVPFLQLDGMVKGSYAVKNTGDPTKSAGFFPGVTVAVSPFDVKKTLASPLVFPGIERSKDFELKTGRFGFYKVSASFGGSSKEVWVFIASPWQIVAMLLVLLVVGAGIAYWLRHRHAHEHVRRRR